MADNSTRLEFNNTFGLRTVSTEHFEIIYRPRFAWAVPDVASEAETAYGKLDSIFSSFPQQKIILHIVDSADGPINQTLTAPQPFIRIWVAPPSDTNGYGHLRLSNRFRLLIAHELVHLAMGSWHDQSGSIFGQVRSTVTEPMTFPFALLTQSKRFAPLWFHEGAAVFLETWLTDGQGRIMGNLDEAYFRTSSLHNADIPDWKTLDVETIDDAFNVNGAYFYGARFMAWLASQHGSKKVVQWLRDFRGASITSPFGVHYKRIFGQSLSHDWKDFFAREFAFQQENIARVSNGNPHKELAAIGDTTGLVSKTYSDPVSGDVFFIEIPLHELPRLVQLNPLTGKRKIMARGRIGSPAFVNVAVTAFDHQRRLFYFSQDTAIGWRDLYQVDVSNGVVSKVANNLRQTNLTVEPKSGDLWGTVLLRGESHIARLKRPYTAVELFSKLPLNASLRDFSFSPDGKSIAAILQNYASTQLVLIDPQKLAAGGSLNFTTIASHQDPENPTWSPDGDQLYFSSYQNGVSNVYRHSLADSETQAISNVPDGLYKPTILHSLSKSQTDRPQVLAFQLLAGTGFQPVLIPANQEYQLTNIHYLGKAVVEGFSELTESISISKAPVAVANTPDLALTSEPFRYKPLQSLRINTLVPAFGRSSTGETAFGMFSDISDILNHHRFSLGLSTNDDFDDVYLDLNYRYKDVYVANISRNRSSLYTLVNDTDPTPDNWNASLTRRFWYQADEAGRKIFDLGIGYNDNLKNAFVSANYTSANTRASITGRRGIEKGWIWGVNGNLFVDVNNNISPSSDPSATLELRGQLYETFISPHNRLGLLLNAGTSFGGDAVGFRVSGFPNQTFESRGPQQHQNSAVLPGLDTDVNTSLITEHFARVQIENNFPVLRLYKALGSQRADLVEVRTFGTALFSDARNLNSPQAELDRLYSLGAQVDVRLKHFFNLNSTLSFGYAKVWDENLDSYDSHGFISWNWFSF